MHRADFGVVAARSWVEYLGFDLEIRLNGEVGGIEEKAGEPLMLIRHFDGDAVGERCTYVAGARVPRRYLIWRRGQVRIGAGNPVASHAGAFLVGVLGFPCR